MAQTFDEQLKRTLGSIAERLHISLTEQVGEAVEQLSGAAASERQMTTAEAVAAAEKELTARLEAEFAHRAEEIKEAARTEWFQTGLTQAHAEAQAKLDEHATQSRSALDAAQKATEQAVADLAAAHAEIHQLRQERERHAQALVDASAQAAAQTASARADALVESDVRFRALLEALRTIDAATSLTHTLDALVAAAKPQVDRLALFLLRGDTLWSWSHTGFEPLHDFGAQTEFALAHAGVLADAVRTGAAQSIAGADSRRPAFAGPAAPGSAFIACPIMMNGQAVGVLCGEQLAGADAGARTTSIYDLLVRHAARVLESLTALRLANVSAHTAAPQH